MEFSTFVETQVYYFCYMQREVIITADGSRTIFIPEMNEHYHSSHGALQEALHVFIQNGFSLFYERNEVVVFEMGFGTGLNAFLTLLEAHRTGKKVRYKGIEAYPVSLEMALDMEYPAKIGQGFDSEFKKIHEVQWNESVVIDPFFELEKIGSRIEDYQYVPGTVDLIYFDAFGPRAQSDMWELPVLEKMADLLKPGGVLVTYCAKGQFKRDLRALGLEVESLPGPPGKREMTRAVKKEAGA